MESDNAQEEMEVDFPEGKENGRKLTRYSYHRNYLNLSLDRNNTCL